MYFTTTCPSAGGWQLKLLHWSTLMAQAPLQGMQAMQGKRFYSMDTIDRVLKLPWHVQGASL
jgi:hypothetical protein